VRREALQIPRVIGDDGDGGAGDIQRNALFGIVIHCFMTMPFFAFAENALKRYSLL
jgi:hypothetical protein